MDNLFDRLQPIRRPIIGFILLRLGLHIVHAAATMLGVEPPWGEFVTSGAVEPAIDLLFLTPLLLTLVYFRHVLPSTLGPHTFGFRAGLLWWMASFALVLNQFGLAASLETIAFIGTEVTRTAFFAMYLVALAARWKSAGGTPSWLGMVSVFLIVATFLSQLFWAFSGEPPSPLLFAGSSLFPLISGTIAIWMLREETF